MKAKAAVSKQKKGKSDKRVERKIEGGRERERRRIEKKTMEEVSKEGERRSEKCWERGYGGGVRRRGEGR